MQVSLELFNQPLTWPQVAGITGLSTGTLHEQAQRGELDVARSGRERPTSRRLLHTYPITRDEYRGGKVASLTEGHIPSVHKMPPLAPAVTSATGESAP